MTRKQNHPNRTEEFLTTMELMQLLRVRHKQTIYNMIDRGMPKLLVGRTYRFIKNEIIDFLKDYTEERRNRYEQRKPKYVKNSKRYRRNSLRGRR